MLCMRATSRTHSPRHTNVVQAALRPGLDALMTRMKWAFALWVVIAVVLVSLYCTGAIDGHGLLALTKLAANVFGVFVIGPAMLHMVVHEAVEPTLLWPLAITHSCPAKLRPAPAACWPVAGMERPPRPCGAV